jgi:copper homeostasis protein
MTILIEAAVESLDDALSAADGGADRLELCLRLDLGGTTPDRELIESVLDRVDIPVLAMIRPRGGSFTYSARELARMVSDIAMASELGVAGVVFGVLDAEHRVDIAATKTLIEAAGELPVTFHRAIDRTPDILAALDALASLGVARVLTSGGAPTAREGIDTIAALVEQAGDTLSIVAGGGVRHNNVREIVERTGVSEVHARCEGDAQRIRAIRSNLPRIRPAEGGPPGTA